MYFLLVHGDMGAFVVDLSQSCCCVLYCFQLFTWSFVDACVGHNGIVDMARDKCLGYGFLCVSGELFQKQERSKERRVGKEWKL